MDARTFLTHIFRDCTGVPITANAEEGFQSRRWKPGEAPPEGKTYFGISTVLDIPRTRILRRRTEDLVETRVIVLDDWGTKVKKALPLEPSYLLETSPGNFQPGFILKYGVEPARAAALIEALAAAGWTDPGAKRADRIMRIPGSLNTKYAEPWRARLTSWKPDLTYTLSEIAVAFGVVPTDVPTSIGGPAVLEEGETDPVFEWLIAHGLVISGPNARGWYAVRCPWEGLHSGEVDHGTDYLPGKPGAFVCLHGHCQDKRTAALRAWILEQDPAAELGLVSSVQLADLRNRLGAALGLLTTAPDSSRRDEVTYERDAAEDVGETAAGGSLDRLWGALQARAAAGTMFAPKTIDEASLSPTQRLTGILREVYLDPELLPDPDTTAGGKVARGQTTTAPRVHTVMDLIGMRARWNVLSGKAESTFDRVPDYVELVDKTNGGGDTLVHACARAGMKNSDAIMAALVNRALDRPYSPVCDWIESAPWRGISLLEALYSTITMQDRSPEAEQWKRIAIRRWLIQGAAAMWNWKLDMAAVDVGYMLILQGETGLGKSKWIERLLPAPWVSIGKSLKFDHGNERDTVSRVTGTAITEIGELDGSFRKSDDAAMKNFLTTTIDTYRPPYGKRDISRPRGTIFSASVNPTGFLKDVTGERRYWPLAVAAVDFEAVERLDRQQLWAEVKALRDAGEQYWLKPEEMKLHQKFAVEHRLETNSSIAIDDIVARRNAFFDVRTWQIVNLREIARRYELRDFPSLYNDLVSALVREGFTRTRTSAKKGWLLPPLDQIMTPAQVSGFQIVTEMGDLTPPKGGKR